MIGNIGERGGCLNLHYTNFEAVFSIFDNNYSETGSFMTVISENTILIKNSEIRNNAAKLNMLYALDNTDKDSLVFIDCKFLNNFVL